MRLGCGPSRTLGSNAVGAARELIVAADLILRGYPTFRSITYTDPWDLVAEIGGRLARVNVRTASRRSDGSLVCATPASRFDILALVCGSDIEYRPSLAAFAETSA